MSSTNNILKTSVESQLPEFIQVDHPGFVAFMEAYFEWLEGEYSEFSPLSIKNANDVDDSLDLFADYFRSQYLKNFPKNLANDIETGSVDQKTLIKKIKDFYRSKGTESSYRFLFQVLFNTDIEFYLPKQDILRASSGHYIRQTSIRTTANLDDDFYQAVGKRIRQVDLETKQVRGYARVERMIQYRIDEFSVTELFINDIQGNIDPGFPILFETDSVETKIETSTYSVLTGLSIDSGGLGHVVGEPVTITSTSGKGAKAEVSRIGSSGEIKKIRILDFGVGYDSVGDITLSFVRTDDEIDAAENLVLADIGAAAFANLTQSQLDSLVNAKFNSGLVGASATPTIGAVCRHEGFYANNTGQLSTNKVLQDNRYYQDFSYVIKSEIVVERYKESVKQLLHPAGFAFFGSVLIKRCVKGDLENTSSIIQYELPQIGNYAPYDIYTVENLSEKLPDGYFSTIAGATLATPGDPDGDPYWIVFAHPNTRNIEGITAGCSFGVIEIGDFVRIKTGYSFDCGIDDNPDNFSIL
jgi:hypothetical protein